MLTLPDTFVDRQIADNTPVLRAGRHAIRRVLASCLCICSLSLCWWAVGSTDGTPAQQPRDLSIGDDDSRIGYDKPDFITRTRSLTTRIPRSANLSDLAQNPPTGLGRLTDPPHRSLIDLGRRLFFDRRLSANETLSCGMCHVPEQAFTQNELATPVGIEGALVLRNAPSLYNVAYRPRLFLDGRETTLTEQIWAPLLANNEMGNSTRSDVLRKVESVTEYRNTFGDLFSDGITEKTLGIALAAYQRALLSANSPFDRWYYSGEQSALSLSEKRGFQIFETAGCASCHKLDHASAQFTDDLFHNTGTGFASSVMYASPPEQIQLAPGVFVPLRSDVEVPDRTDYGREAVTGDPEDRWRFRTPSLRNVALTGPYMHDGSIATLSGVVRFYNEGGSLDPDRDPRMLHLELTEKDQQALVQFLESLTGDNVEALAADARTAPVGDRDSE
jgi:cytochrome c peroxidase